ncbi:MAG: helix-hairpin-helix domain-containing protein [Deltaproteobacteria bacterium]|nr:helix-hairpin-helix domain-containing protein [Deltaproteobacteria bacterium]
MTPVEIISREFKLPRQQIESLSQMTDAGNSPSYLAFYRSEKTGGVNEFIINKIIRRKKELLSLDEKKKRVCKRIEDLGQMTDALLKNIDAATSKAELNDVFLAYQPDKQGKGVIAVAQGLKPFAELLLRQEPLNRPIESLASDYLNPEKGVTTPEKVLEGVRCLISDMVAENPQIRKEIRKLYNRFGVLRTRATSKTAKSKISYLDYVDEDFSFQTVVGQKYMAIQRAERQKLLTAQIEIDDNPILDFLNKKIITTDDSIVRFQLEAIISDAYHRLIKPSLQAEIKQKLWERSQEQTVVTLAGNLYNFLMQATLKDEIVLSVFSAGRENGCPTVVIDKEGQVIDGAIWHCHDERKNDAEAILTAIISKHNIAVIALSQNEHTAPVRDFLKAVLTKNNLQTAIVTVQAQEAPAYAASEVAQDELKVLNEGLRCAVYVGCKLKDPLAAMVMVDPLKIHLGPFQQDIDQQQLAKRLHFVFEVVINRIGADINTASVHWLRYISGLNDVLAKAIDHYRKNTGLFASRDDLLKVDGIDAQTFEQAVGFLFVRDSQNPLEGRFIHPRQYGVVQQMAESLNKAIPELIKDGELLKRLDITKFQTEEYSEQTLTNIITELVNPDGDIRPRFEILKFDPAIKEIKDLTAGQIIKSRVVNMASYGMFVDIGLEQEALVHRSQMPENLSRNFSWAFKLGQTVSVRVIEVDKEKNRVQLGLYIEPRPKPRPQPRYEQRASEQQADAGPDAGSDQRPDRRSDRRPNRGPDRRSDRRPNRGPDRRPDTRSDRRPDARSERRPDQNFDRNHKRYEGRDRRDDRGGSDRRPDRMRHQKSQPRSQFGTLGDQFKDLFNNKS